MKEIDPIELGKFLWPKVNLYKDQKEIVYSVWNDKETYVPAGHQLGKDFVAGFIVITYFLTHWPCRIITTSVKDDHLRVLWGEIKRFLQTMEREPSDDSRLIINYREIRRFMNGAEDPISYIHGTVSERAEGLAGHHAAYTLLVIDEASGVVDDAYKAGDTWAKRKLIIGNPYPCTNFFYRGVKEGEIKSEDHDWYYRRIIKIKAENSPNVRLGVAQQKAGKSVTDEELVPGVLTYSEYQRRRMLWDEVRQCIGLDAEFYEGADFLMYPPAWLDDAERRAADIDGLDRWAKTIGVDPGEGEANTCWTVCDEKGLISLTSKRTPDTAQIINETISLIKQWGVPPECVFFDRGGGGKQCADQLRERGYDVQTVAFGESVRQEMVDGYVPLDERLDMSETRYAYKNRRAQMYGLLRERLDPSLTEELFAIPAQYNELRRQLSLIPLRWDQEGRLMLPPKSKPNKKGTDLDNIPGLSKGNKETLIGIIGNSPDEADSLVLAVYGLTQKTEMILGPIF